MSFDLLPAELIEQILVYLDGGSFCTVKRVCKTWFHVAKGIELKSKHWQSLCLQEIPSYVIEELLSYNLIPSDVSSVCWRSLYRKWYKGRIFKKPIEVWNTIDVNLTNPISCIKISGSFIITGHNNGYVRIWNQETGELDQECACHFSKVSCIVLVDLLKLGMYCYNHDLHWAHHHMITVSKDSMIHVKFLLEPLDCSENGEVLNKHGDSILSAHIFEDGLFVFSCDNTISYWKLRVSHSPSLELHVEYQCLLLGPPDIAMCVGTWNEQVFSISHAGNLKVYDFVKRGWSDLSYFRNHWHGKVSMPVVKCCIFRDKTVVLHTVSGDLLLSLDDQGHGLYKFPLIPCSITSIILKGTVLAIGGENGSLYLFHVPVNNSLLNLDAPTKLNLSEASIIALDISFEVDLPVVAAATSNSIYIVKLKKPRSEFHSKRVS